MTQRRSSLINCRLLVLLGGFLAFLACAALAVAAPPVPRKGKAQRGAGKARPALDYSLLKSTLLTDEQLSRIVAGDPASGLAPPPAAAEAPATNDRNKPVVQPFVDAAKSTEELLPDRPAITPVDPLERSPTEVVAGFTYNHDGIFHLNFGYVVPQAPLQEYIAPLGLSLSGDEEDTRRVIFGVDISF